MAAVVEPTGAQVDGASVEESLRRSSALQAAAREWLATQSYVVAYWRDLLIDDGQSEEFVAILDAHAAFLDSVASR
jgi:hypothetical protein